MLRTISQKLTLSGKLIPVQYWMTFWVQISLMYVHFYVVCVYTQN